MALGTWWRGDALPELPTLPSFSVRPTTDITLIAKLNDLSLQEIDTRFQNGNSAYLAFIDETPVAYGWVATKSGSVEEIGLAFTLPLGNRYLWDFQTLPEWRSRGIYARFLQAIIRQEMQHAERFWILYKPGHVEAERSIRKAGFHFLGELVLTDDVVSDFELFEQSDRAILGAALLNLPVVVEDENR